MSPEIYKLLLVVCGGMVAVIAYFLQRVLSKNDKRSDLVFTKIEELSKSMTGMNDSMIKKHAEYDVKLNYIARDLDILSKETSKDLNNLGNKIIKLKSTL